MEPDRRVESRGISPPSEHTAAWLASLPKPPGVLGDLTPTTAEQWELVEQWRIIIEAIEILGRAQRWRIEAAKGHAQALLPLVEALQLNDPPDLGALVESHRILRDPPPQPSTLVDAAFSVPALFSAIQELEDSVLTLRLEVEEASKLQYGLETGLELRSNSGNMSRPRKIAEGKAELQRSLNSAAQLDRKADEYRGRLAHLQATITAQLSRQSSITGGASVSEVQALVHQNAEYGNLATKLSTLGPATPDPAVPPKVNSAHKKEQVRRKLTSAHHPTMADYPPTPPIEGMIQGAYKSHEQRLHRPPRKIGPIPRLLLDMALWRRNEGNKTTAQGDSSAPQVVFAFCGSYRPFSKADVNSLRPNTHEGLTLEVADTKGQSVILNIPNYPLHGVNSIADLESLFPAGTGFLLKEPTFQGNDLMVSDLYCYLRVESPTDLVFLRDAYSRRAPSDSYRQTGNTYFSEVKHRLAIEFYSIGLRSLPTDSSKRGVLLLNRAASHLALGCFTTAFHDAVAALTFLPEDAQDFREKACMRCSRALEGMRHFLAANGAYQIVLDDWPENQDAQAGLARTAAFLEQAETGRYDWEEIVRQGPLVDATLADFRGPVDVVELKDGRGGRSLVATVDIKAGELLVVEKAFAVGFPAQPPPYLFVVDLDKRTLRKSADLALVKTITAKLMDSPELAETIYSLYAGPEYPTSEPPFVPFGEPLELPSLGASCSIDTSKLHSVVLHNAIGLPSVLGEPAKDETLPPSALFAFSSLIKHSCAPNTLNQTFGDYLVIRARCPIPAGEEITVRLPRKTQVEGCTCPECHFSQLEGPEQELLRLEALADVGKLVEVVAKDRPARHAETARRLAECTQKIEATYNTKRPSSLRPELHPVLSLKAAHIIKANICTQSQLDQLIAAQVGAMAACGAVVVVSKPWPIKARTLKPNFKSKPVAVPLVIPRLLTVTVTAAPSLHANESVVILAKIAERYSKLGKASEAIVWLKAAIKMSGLIYGGGKEVFRARFLEEIKSLGAAGWETPLFLKV
ncbi:hypothetical protein RQP46_004434 [Phenoliferia psychrophenolica]